MANKGAAGKGLAADRSAASAKSKPAAKPRAATQPRPAAKPEAVAKPKIATTPKAAVAEKATPAARKTGAGTAPSVQPVANAPRAGHEINLPVPAVAAMPVPVPVKKDLKLAHNWKKKPAQELTDAEVIAMPDGEYMNDAQMAFFRHRLVRIKSDILDNAGQTTENLREDTVVVPDPADRATIEEEHALELRTRDRERKLLKKIEQSIARIDAGDYGYCDETGEPIGVPRLLARPTATLSLEAQQRRELKQKMFGD